MPTCRQITLEATVGENNHNTHAQKPLAAPRKRVRIQQVTTAFFLPVVLHVVVGGDFKKNQGATSIHARLTGVLSVVSAATKTRYTLSSGICSRTVRSVCLFSLVFPHSEILCHTFPFPLLLVSSRKDDRPHYNYLNKKYPS